MRFELSKIICNFEPLFFFQFSGDCLSDPHPEYAYGIATGMQFSTFDADHDISSGNCAVEFKGAWWYCQCHLANINGAYLGGAHPTFADGIEWNAWTGYYYSLKFTEMKIALVD